ncbi:hypothetical protein EV426DRAFT_586027 [Tirmania nivea]|nr:hypothetical protein EV426DRAFT_586027 [Tirmania nivea]
MSKQTFAKAMYCEYVAQIPHLHPEDTVESMAMQVRTAMVNKMGPIVPGFHIEDCVFAKLYPDTIASKKQKELPSEELIMIMTPSSGTNPIIHTLKACKTACGESEREAQEAQAEANAERLIREEYEADNQKLENKYEQAERKLQQAMDDRDRAQSERDSAINRKVQSEQHRVLMPLKEKFCTEWESGQEARFERLRNSIMEDFNKQLADHQKTITDHQKIITDHQKTITDFQKQITELRATTRIVSSNYRILILYCFPY